MLGFVLKMDWPNVDEYQTLVIVITSKVISAPIYQVVLYCTDKYTVIVDL